MIRKLAYLLLVCILAAGCGSNKPSSSDPVPPKRNAEGLEYLNSGYSVPEKVVLYRGFDLHCVSEWDGYREGLLSCDFMKFYAEHPNFLPRGGK